MAVPILGVIADDFTGATDIGSMLVRGGMKVIQTIGPPAANFDYGDVDAIVVALRTRSIPAADAVAQSLSALGALQQAGVSHVQFKYCSTFDSTPEGNIGPVSDALAAEVGCDQVVHVPALPVNGRIVFKGHLFVGDVLLHESGMQNHPLNPMTDANLVRWLGQQVPGQVGCVDHAALVAGADHAQEVLKACGSASHVIGDAIDDADLETWAELLQGARFFAGGSGLATPLARKLTPKRASSPKPSVDIDAASSGHSLILAGSCSQATLAQIEVFRQSGKAVLQIDPISLDSGEMTIDSIAERVTEALQCGPVLVHGSASPEEVQKAQSALGVDRAGAVIETALSELANRLAPLPEVARIVVAGGETSGTVVSRLAVAALRIGEEIDPGVPWTMALDRAGKPVIPLALKSGNFGAPDFFLRTSKSGDL
ncbi:MAG: 3-oxo-tetronate kinase [Pseudomonadota bacterium]